MKACAVLCCLALVLLLPDMAVRHTPGAAFPSLFLSAPTKKASAASLGKKPQPLTYTMFGLTLDDSPATFRKTLKKAHYLLTRMEQRHGLSVMCFTSARGRRLFTQAYVAFCPETGQTVGVYAVSENGEELMKLVAERFHLGGNDRTVMPEGSPIGGAMKHTRAYRKAYPNVTVSYYPNTPYATYTLALESPAALEKCTRFRARELQTGTNLAREIWKESRKNLEAD